MREHHKDQILAVLKHYLPQDLRAIVMREAPAAYNEWVGRDVIEVRRIEDGKRI